MAPLCPRRSKFHNVRFSSSPTSHLIALALGVIAFNQFVGVPLLLCKVWAIAQFKCDNDEDHTSEHLGFGRVHDHSRYHEVHGQFGVQARRCPLFERIAVGGVTQSFVGANGRRGKATDRRGNKADYSREQRPRTRAASFRQRNRNKNRGVVPTPLASLGRCVDRGWVCPKPVTDESQR